MSDYAENEDKLWGGFGEMDGEYEDPPEDPHAGHNHGGHSHNMAMNFHGKHQGVIFLFEGLELQSNNHVFWYSLVTLLMGILIEYIKDYRLRYTCAKINATSKNYKILHIKDSVLHLVQTTIGYFLMLIAMTFHYVLFSAAMIGMALGFYIFNKVDKSDVNDVENDKLVGCKGHMASKSVTQDSCGC